jgi:hypothetical protein
VLALGHSTCPKNFRDLTLMWKKKKQRTVKGDVDVEEGSEHFRWSDCLLKL